MRDHFFAKADIATTIHMIVVCFAATLLRATFFLIIRDAEMNLASADHRTDSKTVQMCTLTIEQTVIQAMLVEIH